MTTTTEPTDLYEKAVQAAILTFRARGVAVEDETVRAAMGAARGAYVHAANVTERPDLEGIQAQYDRYCEASDKDEDLVNEAMLCADNVVPLLREVGRLQGEVARRDAWHQQQRAEYARNVKGWREQVDSLKEQLAVAFDGDTIAAKVAGLIDDGRPFGIEPPNGSLVLAHYRSDQDRDHDYSRVWERNDRKDGQERGDWYEVEGPRFVQTEGGTIISDPSSSPESWGVVLGRDDPEPYGLGWDLLVPAYEIAKILSPTKEK